MKIIVSYLGKKKEHTIKAVKGQDSLLEAAKQEVRSLQRLSPEQPRVVSVIMECYRKGFQKKGCIFNTYFVLLAAGMTEEAERLRTRFKSLHDIDVAKEPTRNPV
jgi:hypothetical protein